MRPHERVLVPSRIDERRLMAPLALVTGCAGFIGSHLTESLLQDGIAVVGVDCFNDNYGRKQKLANLAHAQEWDDFEFVPIDLARGSLRDLVASVDVIFHLAAEPGVRSSWGSRFELYARNNILSTQHLLDAVKDSIHKRFVYASSSSVYGQAEVFPTPEEALPSPLSPYGVTKLAAEQLCMAYHANYGVPVTALRYFTVFGPRQRPDMAFNIFCRAAIKGEEIRVFGTGEQTRDFTFVSDVVAATRAAGESQAAAGHVYNIGGGLRASLREVLGHIEEFAGELRVEHVGREHGDVHDTGADTAKAHADLGWQPKISLSDGLHAEFLWLESELRSASASRGAKSLAA